MNGLPRTREMQTNTLDTSESLGNHDGYLETFGKNNNNNNNNNTNTRLKIWTPDSWMKSHKHMSTINT